MNKTFVDRAVRRLRFQRHYMIEREKNQRVKSERKREEKYIYILERKILLRE